MIAKLLNKIKWYLIGAGILVILFAIIQIQSKRIKSLKSDNIRIENNNFQLLADNRAVISLNLKDKEVIGQLRHSRDSLAKSLKIAPKQVEKIIYQTMTVHDSVDRPVYVTNLSKNTWAIQDTGRCFTWSGIANLTNNFLNVKRTDFSYHNKTTEIYYRKRPHKFICIHYGKWKYFEQISSECGSIQEKTFNFTK